MTATQDIADLNQLRSNPSYDGSSYLGHEVPVDEQTSKGIDLPHPMRPAVLDAVRVRRALQKINDLLSAFDDKVVGGAEFQSALNALEVSVTQAILGNASTAADTLKEIYDLMLSGDGSLQTAINALNATASQNAANVAALTASVAQNATAIAAKYGPGDNPDFGSAVEAKFPDDTRYGFFEVRNASGHRGGYWGQGDGGLRLDFRADYAEFARLISIQPSIVSRWASGETRPSSSSKTLLRLLRKRPELVSVLREIRDE